MDNRRFPPSCGPKLGDKTFRELFDTNPKMVEFVRRAWLPEKTTGIYSEFLTYVLNELQIPDICAAHEERAAAYRSENTDIPSYMRTN